MDEPLFIIFYLLSLIVHKVQKKQQNRDRTITVQSCSDYVHIPAIMSVIWDFVKVKLPGNTL